MNDRDIYVYTDPLAKTSFANGVVQDLMNRPDGLWNNFGEGRTMNRDEWLSRLQQGHVAFEITSSAQTLVRVTERKGGRLWYENVNGPSNPRCVEARTGMSADLSRNLIPQEAWEDDLDDRVWDMYGTNP